MEHETYNHNLQGITCWQSFIWLHEYGKSEQIFSVLVRISASASLKMMQCENAFRWICMWKNRAFIAFGCIAHFFFLLLVRCRNKYTTLTLVMLYDATDEEKCRRRIGSDENEYIYIYIYYKCVSRQKKKNQKLNIV